MTVQVTDDLFAQAAELQHRGEPFALATVVRCEPPTPAKPGARALIRADGALSGWVGGACAEPVIVREALQALRDGQPRLVALYGEGGRNPGRTEGLLSYPMTCHSGGSLEIYVEPHLPKPLLVIVGHGPAVETLATLGRAADFSVVSLRGETALEELSRLSLTPRAAVVVGTHGDADEATLVRVLGTAVGYVSLIASRRRATAVLAALRDQGVPADRLGQIKAPAGLDIGAVTPEEIAVSILAEVIQHRRNPKPGALEVETSPATSAAEVRDPVCGMPVEVSTARYRTASTNGPVFFCCLRCKESFEQDPERYLPHRAR